MAELGGERTIRCRELGIAVIGAGRMGSQRASVAATHPAVRYLAVADIDPARARTVGAKVNAQFTSGDNLEVISRPEVNAVIVSTPQDVGLQISMKTLRMFQQTKVHIFGIIENMSTYFCPHCGAQDDIFGNGGAARASQEIGVPFLGAIPLDRAIRAYADKGMPVLLAAPDSPSGKALQEVTGKLAQQISIQAMKTLPLAIVEE